MSSSKQSLVDLQSKENWNNHQMYNVSLVIQTKFSEKDASFVCERLGKSYIPCEQQTFAGC